MRIIMTLGNSGRVYFQHRYVFLGRVEPSGELIIYGEWLGPTLLTKRRDVVVEYPNQNDGVQDFKRLLLEWFPHATVEKATV